MEDVFPFPREAFSGSIVGFCGVYRDDPPFGCRGLPVLGSDGEPPSGWFSGDQIPLYL